MLNRQGEVAADAEILPEPLAHIRHEILEGIEHYLQKPKRSVYRDLKGMCERVSEGYRDRVVVELLQNAHDAHAPGSTDGCIRISLDPDEGDYGTLYVANGGDGFTRKNFEALCSPTRTTKNVNEAIGNKGVGFLSVFQVCSHPEVYSRLTPQSRAFDGFCFAFATDALLTAFLEREGLGDHAAQVIANMPRLYLACPLPLVPDHIAPLAAKGFATVLRLPLKGAEALSSVKLQLAKLTEESPPVQLFLSRIHKLSVSIDPAQDDVVLDRHCKTVLEQDDLMIVTADCGARSFVLAQKTIPYERIIEIIRQDVRAEVLPEAWLDWTGDATVSVAVAAQGAPLESRMYNFLPMGEEAAAPFRGYLDAPFLATLDRLRLQTGIQLNSFLMETARRLAVEAGTHARTALPAEQARRAVLDLILWTQDRDLMRERVLDAGALIPCVSVRGITEPWAPLARAKVWQGDDFLTADYVARFAPFPLVDPQIGPERLSALRGFVWGANLLAISAEDRADLVERIAEKLPKPPKGLPRWDQFYRSLAELFRDNAEVLAGRRLLLTARGDLALTETSNPVRGRGRRRRRLSSTFLPPLRGAADGTRLAALPRAVQRRLAYVHPELELASDGSSAGRRFLIGAGLVRDHESREILRLLANAIAEPGETADPDRLRWDALDAMMRLVAADDISESVLAEINPHVPTRDGWVRAATAYFGKWPGTRGGDLEELFIKAAGISPELDQHAARLLLRYSAWSVPAHERDSWTSFLFKAGVTDVLRPVPAFGASPRSYPNQLGALLAQRSGLPDVQRSRWLLLVSNFAALPNPMTEYMAADVFRLPGQLDHDALSQVAALEYAQQLIRRIEASPSTLKMSVYRPAAHHSNAQNRREYPSPINAFVSSAHWIPLTNGQPARLNEAWLPGAETRSPPPLLPLASIEFRHELARYDTAASELRKLGLADYGRYPWRFLKVAGDLVGADAASGDAERLLSAAQEAWQHANLEMAPPAGLKLIGRRAGRIVSADPETSDEAVFLIADGDDRQMVAASARARPDAIVFEPPVSRRADVAAYLATRYPKAVRRASSIPAHYESGGVALAPDAEDPLLTEVLGDAIRQVVALALRYRCSFYHGNTEEALARLGNIRFRKLHSLSLKVGDLVEPVPRFDERALVLPGAGWPTILCSEGLANSPNLLVGLAPAIGAALGNQRQIGEPLMAFAAEFGAHGLDASFEEYAAVLSVPVADIKGFLGAARASIGNLLRTLRPFIGLYAGKEAADKFVAGAGLVSEEDVLRLLEQVKAVIPISPAELIRRYRESADVAALALALSVDLRLLNAQLEALGPPYAPVDFTEKHAATLAAFLGRKEALIRESIRHAFRPAFEACEDLSPYVAAMKAPRPTLPDDFGRIHIELTQSQAQQWLDAWLAGLGVEPITTLPTARNQLEAVQDANLKQLRGLVPELRTAILARAEADHPLRARWATKVDAETAVTNAALSGGWIDFDRLDEAGITSWLIRTGLWPPDLPRLGDLAITEVEREAQCQADERARVAASAVKRKMDYSGGTFIFGEDSMGSLADRISGLVASNSTLLNTSSRLARGNPPILGPGTGGGGGGGGGNRVRPTEEERSLIGFFGEAIAFEWLKRRYGEKRVVDLSCWKSGYRKHICGEEGEDSLGYDFELTNGNTTWQFEVKATTAPGPLQTQSLELGSTEMQRAEICKADKRLRYRILYVTDALYPERARIFPLPNPRSRQGMTFFSDKRSGQRLYFGLDD